MRSAYQVKGSPGDAVVLGTEKRTLILPTIIGVIMSGAVYTPYDLEIGKGI